MLKVERQKSKRRNKSSISRKVSRKVSKRKSSRNVSKRKSSRKVSRKVSKRKTSYRRKIGSKRVTKRTYKRTYKRYVNMRMVGNDMLGNDVMRFIHFGCWNRNGCDKKNASSDLSKVINLLDNYIENIENSEQPKVEFITIAGDNYYPDKVKIGGKKLKVINENNMKSGFECLPKQIPKYLLLGNHDLENIEDCKILTYQQNEYAKIDANKTVFDDNTEDDIMHKILGNNDIGYTVLIMIDTTMYDKDYEEKGLEELLDCYRKIKGLENIDTLENLRKKQENRITNLINKIDTLENIKNVIVLGHHPIVSVKSKEKDDGKIKTVFSDFDLLKELYYNNIYSQLKIHTNINYYYLCADVHMYQRGSIIINDDLVINQYILGTGGAENDTLENNFKTLYEKDGLTYTLIENKVNFGFLDCVIKNDGQMAFKFIEIDNEVKN